MLMLQYFPHNSLKLIVGMYPFLPVTGLWIGTKTKKVLVLIVKQLTSIAGVNKSIAPW